MGSYLNAIKTSQGHDASPVVVNDLSGFCIQECCVGLARKVYDAWFCVNKYLVETFKRLSLPAVGVSLGMLLLEGHILCKSAWFTFFKYNKEPHVYGLEQIEQKHKRKNPVLLFHGAAGSWNYLGDLATELSHAGIPVFVINLGGGDVTEEKRKLVGRKIDQIRELYAQRFPFCKKPKVDLVAHSMGSNVAMATAFSKRCSWINEQGDLEWRKGRTIRSNSNVGKVITLANPSNAEELGRISQVGKSHSLFNIIAQDDALMGHKTCALTGRYACQATEIKAGHVGIVFKPETFHTIKQILS